MVVVALRYDKEIPEDNMFQSESTQKQRLTSKQ